MTAGPHHRDACPPPARSSRQAPAAAVWGLRVMAMLLAASVTGCATFDEVQPTNHKLVAAAIKREVEHLKIDGNYLFKLPAEGGRVEGKVRQTLGAKAWFEGMDKLPTLKMPLIEVVFQSERAWIATVDIVEPVDPLQVDGERRLVTLRMRWEGDGWFLKHRQVWQLPLEEALRASERARGNEAPPNEGGPATKDDAPAIVPDEELKN